MTGTHGGRGVREPHPDNPPSRDPHRVDPVRHACGRVFKHAPRAPSPACQQAAIGVSKDVAGFQRGDTDNSHHAQAPTRCVYVETVVENEAKAKEVLMSKKWVKPAMVGGARRAAPRNFTIKKMLRKCKYVYNVRKAPPEVVKAMREHDGCSEAELNFPLAGKSSRQIRRALRKALAKALAAKEKKVAFAKDLAFDDRPRADNLEEMVATFPGLHKIDWKAKSVKSGINCGVWKAYHARHCDRCTPITIHDECYFKVIHHFLRTGFDPPEDDEDHQEQDAPRAYVNKWMKDEARCNKSFSKWVNECEDLISAISEIWPEFFSPLLPVAREKDKWRWIKKMVDYKIRLCLDLKVSGYNKRLLDWLFRYCGIEVMLESIKKGDWLAALDISRFYLRLPAGKRLRAAQWFQDPSSYAKSTHNNNHKDKRKLRFRQLLAVAFGLKSAPAWASLVSGELCRILRSFGIDVAGVYIDDLLIRALSRAMCEQDMHRAEQIASALGLPFNEKRKGPAQDIPFLGYQINTLECTVAVMDEYRRYALSRLEDALKKKHVSLATLESIAGILTWIAGVFDAGKPRRNLLYRLIAKLKKTGLDKAPIRGDLRSQLHWWLHVLRDNTRLQSKFWDVQPNTPIACSDASGDDGWGACVMGLHIVGPWPEDWKQSTGSRSVSMHFKELVPPTISSLLLGPMLDQHVLCAALDNAGTAFSINSLTCGCAMSLELLRPLSDSLSRGRHALLAGHAHREHNAHSDALSHPLTDDIWSQVRASAAVKKGHRLELHFVVYDVATAECYVATISFKDPAWQRSKTDV